MHSKDHSIASLLNLIDYSGFNMIACIGGGGKTTTISVLANLMAAHGERVLVTTTTKMWPQLPGANEARLIKDIEMFQAWLKAEKNQLEFLGHSINSQGKLIGVPIQWIEQYQQQLAESFDYIFIEADGSKNKSVKWPLPGEPLVPSNADAVIGVVGLDIIGKILSEDSVHRADSFSLQLDLPLGNNIGWSTLAKYINHPEGLFSGVSKQTPLILLLNKYNPGMATEVEHLISHLLNNEKFTDRVNNIVVADMQSKTSKIDRVISCV